MSSLSNMYNSVQNQSQYNAYMDAFKKSSTPGQLNYFKQAGLKDGYYKTYVDNHPGFEAQYSKYLPEAKAPSNTGNIGTDFKFDSSAYVNSQADSWKATNDSIVNTPATPIDGATHANVLKSSGAQTIPSTPSGLGGGLAPQGSTGYTYQGKALTPDASEAMIKYGGFHSDADGNLVADATSTTDKGTGWGMDGYGGVLLGAGQLGLGVWSAIEGHKTSKIQRDLLKQQYEANATEIFNKAQDRKELREAWGKE